MGLRPGTPSRAIVAALLAGCLLRLAFGLGYWRDKPLTHDEQEYLALALNLAAGRGFTGDLPGASLPDSAETFSRAPLYPVLLAGIFRVTGQPTDAMPPSVPRAVQVVQAFVAVLGLWLVGRFASRAGGPWAGAVATWLAALYPPLVWSSAYALSEAVYSPLVLGGAWLLGAVIDRRPFGPATGDGRRVLVAGSVLGLAALVRSAALVVVPLAMLWLCWRRRVVLAAVLVAGTALVVAPWSLRNLSTHGRLIVVAADGGITFWTGNHPLARGEGDMAANPRLKEAHVEFRRPLRHLTPEQREPYYYRAAFAYMAEHPGQWLWLTVRKFFYTWVPIGPSYTLHSPRYYWATVLTYVPLLLMACAGLPRLARSKTPPLALALLVASSVLICVVFFPQERFRLPVIDPALCVGAAAWLAARLRTEG